MNYEELIARALKGRSVNSMAKAWGIPQPRLDRYVKGKHLPDYETAMKIAEAAEVEPGEAFRVLVQEERNHKARNFKLQMGSAQPGLVSVIALLALAVNLFLTPATAKATPSPMTGTKTTAHTLYIMSNAIRKYSLRAILAWRPLK